MQFSDTTNRNGLLQDCEFWTNLGDTAISADNATRDHFTRSINVNYHKVVSMILESQDEWDFDDPAHTDFAELTTSLVADQRDYSIPAAEKVLKIKRVEITYDGTNYYKAEPLDINQVGVGTGNAVTIDGNFTKTAPSYDLKKNSILIYPRADADDVTDGGLIKIWWTREIDEFTDADTTQEPGFDEPFHRMLSIGASIDWFIVNKPDNPKIAMLQNLYNDYEVRLRQHYSNKQQDRHVTLQSAFVDYG